MRAHPFALLVTLGADGPAADSLPFILDVSQHDQPRLRAHVARANPVWRNAVSDSDALVVFQGPHAYVTPSWYATKHETGKVVPTWNYITVQARGRLTFHHDAEWIRAHVSELTQLHEGGRSEPWQVRDAPADFVEKLLGAVVGVDIAIASLQGKWKLSQNRPLADRAGVAEGLAQEAGDGARGVRDEMGKIP